MNRLRIDNDHNNNNILTANRRRQHRFSSNNKTSNNKHSRKSGYCCNHSAIFLSVFATSLFLIQFVVFLQVWNHHVELHKVVVSILKQQQQKHSNHKILGIPELDTAAPPPPHQHVVSSSKTTILDLITTTLTGTTNHDEEPLKAIAATAATPPPPPRLPLQQPKLTKELWRNVVPKVDNLVVNYGDSIYMNNDWNSAPIVIEEYRLIFFTTAKNACTIWLQLLRRMMHIEKWYEINNNVNQLLPWNPELNGLKYLYDYNITYVNEIMIHPKWTRAIFVRDPIERFVSAYIDKVVRNENYIYSKCCPHAGACVEPAKSNITSFLHYVAYFCHNQHWRPQHYQMTSKQWSYINFVGHMDYIQDDSERLLKRIGRWEEYGSTGWGSNRKERIFQKELIGDKAGRSHATNAKNLLRTYITPELEQELMEEYYAQDYNHPVMKLEKVKLY